MSERSRTVTGLDKYTGDARHPAVDIRDAGDAISRSNKRARSRRSGRAGDRRQAQRQSARSGEYGRVATERLLAGRLRESPRPRAPVWLAGRPWADPETSIGMPNR